MVTCLLKESFMNPTLQTKLDRLDRETEILFNSVGDLSEKQLHDTTYGWSIIQVLAHLHDAEKASLLYMSKKMQAGDKMPAYALGNKLRMALSKMLLQTSLKWKAPKAVAHPKSESSMSEMKVMWEATREQTRTYLEHYPEQYLDKAVYKHPMAGRLDLASAIDSMMYHQRHHLHQVKRIKKRLGIQ